MIVKFKTKDWPGCPRCFSEFIRIVEPEILDDGRSIEADIQSDTWAALSSEVRDAITYLLTHKQKHKHHGH